MFKFPRDSPRAYVFLYCTLLVVSKSKKASLGGFKKQQKKAMANVTSFETDGKDIETLFCVEPVSKESNSVMKVTEPVSMQTSTEKASVFVQSWWRMASAQKSYREHLQPVHKVTFVVALIIRILVVIYLFHILDIVVPVVYNSKLQIQLEDIGPAKEPEALEQSVLRELMTKDSLGYVIVATCR